MSHWTDLHCTMGGASLYIARLIREEMLRCHADPSRIVVHLPDEDPSDVIGVCRHLFQFLEKPVIIIQVVLFPAFMTRVRLLDGIDFVLKVESIHESVRSKSIHTYVTDVPFDEDDDLPFVIPMSEYCDHSIENNGPILVTGCILRQSFGRFNSIKCEMSTKSLSAWYRGGTLQMLEKHFRPDGSDLMPEPDKLTTTDTTINWTSRQVFNSVYRPKLMRLARLHSPKLLQEARPKRLLQKHVSLWLD